MIKDFSLHDLLTFRIVTQRRSLLKGLNSPFSYFASNVELDEPDIVLNIGSFNPSGKRSCIVDHKYHVSEDYFYCEDVVGRASWKVEISGIMLGTTKRSPITVNFDGRLFGIHQYMTPDLLGQEVVLLPLIEVFLGFKGYLLAHAAGISKKGQAVVFFGRPGSMKTTIVMNAMKKGYKVLGDDKVIINLQNAFVYSFPFLHQSFEYNIKKSKTESLNLLQKASLTLNLLKSKRAATDLWENSPSEINRLLFIKRTANERKTKIHPTPTDTATREIIANNRAELYTTDIPSIIRSKGFPSYLLAYSFIFPESRIAHYWKTMEERITSFVEGISLYEVTVPDWPNLDVISNVYEANT